MNDVERLAAIEQDFIRYQKKYGGDHKEPENHMRWLIDKLKEKLSIHTEIAGNGKEIVCGSWTMRETVSGKIWLQHIEGEGMSIEKTQLESIMKQFYLLNF